uniref:Fibronectin type-III domain-containing protein n=1 Tax=Pygocentrus nattereri TaxID=42514 RepID=A0A3B4DIC7_PYGNA
LSFSQRYTKHSLSLSVCLSVSLSVCLSIYLSVCLLSLEQDFASQTLSLTWESHAALFDIEIFRTELEENVLNVTVRAAVDPVSGQRSWTWRSPVPLQCTSHSVQIRARQENTVSQWSPLQIVQGSDVPVKQQAQMYPQDKVVPVGGNLTFCCIVSEGGQFGSIEYKNRKMEVTRMSRRSFATSVTNLPQSGSSGTNIICLSPQEIITGAVVFVGYPPGDERLECETRDLQKAECRWRKGRDTGFWRTSLLTRYTLNGRRCVEANRNMKLCRFDRWENSWTLTAENELEAVQLNDSAHITERVRLFAPVNVSAVPQAWNSSLQWSWTFQAVQTLDLLCQVQLTSGGRSSSRNYTGVGLSAALLDGLRPDVEYSVSVRCASLRSFWRWGDWSAPYSLHTRMDCPEAPDVWVRMDSETAGQILWKPLSISDSHGALEAYEVYQKDGEQDGWTVLSLPPSISSFPVILSNSSSGDVMVAVAARNPVGLSRRSIVVVPEFRADSEQSVSELVGSGGDLELTWQPCPNASRGYLVEWVCTGCTGHCTVQWTKVPESNTSTVIQAASLEVGVRYTLSVFALSDEATALLQRHHGYGHELVPVQSVKSLNVWQSGENVLLSWEPVAISNRRGFIRGYTIYLNNASHLELVANVTDPALRSYTVKGLSLGSYKFTVKAYTSAGEGGGSTVAIKMESNSDMLVVQLLVSLVAMSFCLVVISIFCYKKREWVKKAFYPEIPGPKLAGNWTTPPAPLDIKPPTHSMVHIVESPEWDSSKKGLVPVPEEEEDDNGSVGENVEVDTDSDEPTLLRYYNQLVTDGSHSNYASDTSGSSTSSVDSAQTQVTYTGIQSPTSSHWAPSYGYRPQMQPVEGPEEPAAAFENEPQQESPSIAYRPQCSWQAESPGAENFSGSLGSPTSVTSSQFLIPETAEEDPEPSGTWFQNFLSGKF